MNSSRGYKKQRPTNVNTASIKGSLSSNTTNQSATSQQVGTIPEVNEKEELTTVQVRENKTKANLKPNEIFDFPISGKALTSMNRSKEYFSMHELTEVQEYEDVYYIAKAD